MWYSRVNWAKLAAGAIIGVWFLNIGACQSRDQIAAPDQNLVPELPQPAAFPSSVSGRNITEDFALHPPREDGRRGPLHIWRCLGLDSAQRVAVQVCFRIYRDSVHAVLKALRESERQYWQQAREMRRAVLDSLRQGLLDRRTAAQRLREIAQWLRQQLANNPMREWAAQELVRLRQVLCECVAPILTPEQLQIWECWCSGRTDCCPPNGGDKEGGRRDRDTLPPVRPR
ncbi:MAG: hypothetical protein NZ960_07770 [Candidatus Kapabacteria bacterium]|nr:hypothetical protein [Candidatus Kapabacteria bacterium]MDW8011959.1 hypothetical protein [Bacteroidota bacterium]